jgi:eukaryotic-like serine/threonine-protein kinase
MVDRRGQHIGNYRLIHLIGQGGYAEVYLGQHNELGTQAAVKVLRIDSNSGALDKFRVEARIIAHLEHTHIVRVSHCVRRDLTHG